MDICSFKQVSRGGNRHCLIVDDELSDCTHSSFLNKKSDQIKMIPMWIRGLSKKYQMRSKGSGLTTVVRTEAYKKNVTKHIWELSLNSQLHEHLSGIQWQKEEYQR